MCMRVLDGTHVLSVYRLVSESMRDIRSDERTNIQTEWKYDGEVISMCHPSKAVLNKKSPYCTHPRSHLDGKSYRSYV